MIIDRQDLAFKDWILLIDSDVGGDFLDDEDLDFVDILDEVEFEQLSRKWIIN